MKFSFWRVIPFVVLGLIAGVAYAQTGLSVSELDRAKKKCVELGFKAGTERFGNCVLQLSRDDAKAPAPVPVAPAPAVSTSTTARSPSLTSFKDCDDCPEMVMLPAGTFLMGSKADPFANPPPGPDEQPQHSVSVKAFAMGKYEVTQEQWYAVMGSLPSHFKGRTLPVEQVSWADAKEFVQKLSAKTGKTYRLPSEAEWEYAARAGSQANYSFGDDAEQLGRYAWFVGNASGRTHPVGEKLPNAFGLHDMHGNVWEWTEDCWNRNYSGAPTDGSAWTAGNCSIRVGRGGVWDDSPDYLRAAFRSARAAAGFRFVNLGFRVARTN